MVHAGFFAAAAIAAIALSGCAQTGTSFAQRGVDCAAVDWGAVGFEDGANGFPADVLGQRSADCLAGGPGPNTEAYNSGRMAGLQLYCTPERGYSEGINRQPQRGVCPPELAAGFQKGYNEGRAYRGRSAGFHGFPNIGIGVGVGSRGRTSVGVSLGTVFGF